MLPSPLGRSPALKYIAGMLNISVDLIHDWYRVRAAYPKP